MKTIIVISVLLLGGMWFYQQQPVGKDDIFVDRLVYLKSDSSLFTGTLRISDKASTCEINFCNGLKCGEWGEYQNGGGVVHKGKYLNQNILSRATQTLIATDTFLINHWQEGELPTITYPPYLTVFILKNDAFFEMDKKQYDGYINQIAQAVLNDTHSLKYDYLNISFGNAVYDGSKHYSKEYKLEDGKLVETE